MQTEKEPTNMACNQFFRLIFHAVSVFYAVQTLSLLVADKTDAQRQVLSLLSNIKDLFFLSVTLFLQ
ncbi:hypothetical protein HETIRDRAFT_166699 [Heterobasidion irregulare TC 32-1]|uniref:Uncharacterized protein n=1 Tax=Heterobasidion irregulare (strain TC 32-1) TaxID=747525 RepID=W4KMX5_HETIT|nr:uncharacterized protein HETIRDRAFT_166699 [Heterobasidion irregulare TC 32-1]ETW87167.1 hypothetical protein HETIRDRAFT_166699 [Heterobasidion irregulare TC 32-1]